MRSIKMFFIMLAVVLTGTSVSSEAQVKITDGADITMNANSLLELESSNKGFLLPRVAINSITSVSPLTGTVPAGMLVYSLGGTVANGFYYWSGTAWIPFATGIGSQWITNGTNIYYSTGNVGIGATVPAEPLEVNGDIKIGSATTGTIRATTELVLRQDGDIYGPSILRLRNRTTENGAIFETTDPSFTLVDFIFRNAIHQRNIRLESRATYAKTGTPSFHLGGASPDFPTLSLGDNYAAFNKNVRIGDYTTPLTALDVNGQITLRTGASARAVLVSDANGTGTWTNISGIYEVPVAKSASATLLKTETIVVASGNITLTLPVVTIADNGLSIIINNVGTFTDLVTVVGNGSSTIGGAANSELTRWVGFNYIANGGNWIIANNVNHSADLFDVSSTSSWQTIPEIIAYLNLHMTEASVVRLDGDLFTLPSTQTINLPFPVTFEGLSYGATFISPASGFTGGLFSCATECYFKMISFESTFGATGGHDAIRLTGSGKYYEIKDCAFLGFNKGVSLTTSCTVWAFEDFFDNNIVSGVDIGTGATSGVDFEISESNFSNCGIGINLVSGTSAVTSVQNCRFYGASGGQVGFNYIPATFTTPKSLFFTNNTWNGIGAFLSGFDFTRADGRDANFYIENNAGIVSKSPKCKINVVNNALTTTLTTAGTWYKANWINTSTFTVKWLITGNQIKYQSVNTTDILIIVSGNISTNVANRTITIGIAKNGVIVSPLNGETTLRVTVASQPFQYSTAVYIQNVVKDDYFELYATSLNAGDIVNFQDVNIYVTSQ